MIALPTRGGLPLLVAVLGYVVWSIAFVVLYSVQGYACVNVWPGTRILGISVTTYVLVALWIAHLAAGAALLWFFWRRTRTTTGERGELTSFIYRIACLLAAAGLVSTVYIGAPVLFLEPCGF